MTKRLIKATLPLIPGEDYILHGSKSINCGYDIFDTKEEAEKFIKSMGLTTIKRTPFSFELEE